MSSLMSENAQNRYKWTAWFLPVFCVALPLVVQIQMTESSSKGFIIYSWVYLAYLFLVYLTMAVRALPLDKGWAFMILMATFIWVSVAVVFGSKAYRMAMVNASTARAERVDTTALDVEVQDAAANLYTAVAGGVLAIASMVVQWMADREEAKIQRTYSTEMEG